MSFVPPNDADDPDRTLGPADLFTGTLRIGSLFEGYRLLDVMGEGGFGIVYRALDPPLNRMLAIKEYMPSSLAVRAPNGTVRVKSERLRPTFEAGLRSFVNEAHVLAQFDEPSVARVYRYWEGGGTAYMAMQLYEGPTLKSYLEGLPAGADEAWLLALLDPLTRSLQTLHSANYYHRDIAPDNIILTSRTGMPVLIDFGAARRVVADMTHQLTAIYKSGYAPIEQYDDERLPEEAGHRGLGQGAWTDIYALAATIHFAMLKRKPLPAPRRAMARHAEQPLVELLAGKYSFDFLSALDQALVVWPEERVQSLGDFRLLLGLDKPVPATAPIAAAQVPVPGPSEAPASASIRQEVASHSAEPAHAARDLDGAHARAEPLSTGVEVSQDDAAGIAAGSMIEAAMYRAAVGAEQPAKESLQPASEPKPKDPVDSRILTRAEAAELRAQVAVLVAVKPKLHEGEPAAADLTTFTPAGLHLEATAKQVESEGNSIPPQIEPALEEDKGRVRRRRRRPPVVDDWATDDSDRRGPVLEYGYGYQHVPRTPEEIAQLPPAKGFPRFGSAHDEAATRLIEWPSKRRAKEPRKRPAQPQDASKAPDSGSASNSARPEAVPPQAMKATAPVGSSVPVRFVVNSNTWLSVTAGDGCVHVSRLVREGEVLELSAKSPVSVIIANAMGTALFVRGKRRELAPHTKDNLARLMLM